MWSLTTIDNSPRVILVSATIQIIPVSGDKLYLSHEEQPGKSLCYTFLGGRQEHGEEVLTVAKRELLEESGMESDDWELFKTYHFDEKIISDITTEETIALCARLPKWSDDEPIPAYEK